MHALKTVSPIDGRLYVERMLASAKEIDATLDALVQGRSAWRAVSIQERVARVIAFVEHAVQDEKAFAEELTYQIGRPISQALGEREGFLERAHAMIQMAESTLADVSLPGPPGFHRFIRREPVGTVLVLSPWNYPWLTAVNTLVPALMSGNTVLLKHSDQTPLVAERLAAAAEQTLPPGVFAFLHMSHRQAAQVISDSRVDFVAFTGSVEGGRAVAQAAAERFVGVGWELGGKDPAYVRPDARLPQTAENLADGAFFNAGQSCCAVERIYVHRDIYRSFVDAFVAETYKLVLGDPRDPSTTLGPVVRVANAKRIQSQVEEAIAAGARPLVDAGRFHQAIEQGFPYLAPQVLLNVSHGMPIMREETFGPVVAIKSVADDHEAVAKMNDSRFGLTASIWTEDLAAAKALGDQLETGTVFMNRCDYLDPDLAWVGVKDSGHGCTLSRLGYEQLTRPKSFHLRHRL